MQAIDSILITQTRRTKQTMQSWLYALAQAENPLQPKRQKLYALYDELVLDAHLSAIMQLRREKVLAADFYLVNTKTGAIDNDQTDLLLAPWFYELLEYAVESVYYGHSLIQIDDLSITNKKVTIAGVTLIPRKHVVPEQGWLLRNEHDDKGLTYRTVFKDQLFEFGTNTDLGLLAKTAPNVLYKRFAMGSWSEYCELFAMPLRVGKTMAQDKEMVTRMIHGLRDMGPAAFAVIDKDETIEFLNADKGGETAYSSLIDLCNRELSKLILGATGLAEEKSYVGAAQTHERQADQIVESDKRFIEQCVNYRVLPVLMANGLPLANLRFKYKEAKDLAQLWQFTREAFPYYTVPADFIEDNFGIAVVEKSESDTHKASEQQPQRHAYKTPKQLTKQGFPYNAQPPKQPKSLFKRLLNTLGLQRTSPSSSDLESLIKAIYQGQYANDQIPAEPALSYAQQLWQLVQNNWDINLKNIATEASDNAYLNRLHNNLYAFSAAKSFAMLKELRNLVYDAAGTLKPYTEFRADARKVDEQYNEHWLQAEHQAVKRGTVMGAKWQRVQQDVDMFPYLQYITVSDSRVRPEHRSLYGIVAPVSDPFWNKYYPPNGWRCRCSVQQLSEAEVRAKGIHITPTKIAIQKGELNVMDTYWRKNVGKTVLFEPANTDYFQSLPPSPRAENYGLRSVEDIYEHDENLPAISTEIPTKEAFLSWWQDKSDEQDNIILTDAVTGLKILLEAHFKQLMIDENNVHLSAELENVLNDPHEVWSALKDDAKHFRVYIRYYKGHPLLLAVDIAGKAVSFYQIQSQQEAAHARQGVLIQKRN